MATTGIDERAINLTPKEYARVKEIFTQAIAMEPEARDAYIASAAGTDESIISQVQSLLEHHVEETVLDATDADDTLNDDIVLDAAPESDTFLVQKDVWEDNRQILRRRLMIIATVMTIIITVSTVDWFLSATEETDYIARLIAFVISLNRGHHPVSQTEPVIAANPDCGTVGDGQCRTSGYRSGHPHDLQCG